MAILKQTLKNMIQLKKVKSMEHLGYLLTHNNNIININNDNDNDNIIVINKKKSTNNNTYIKHNLTHQSRLHSKSTSNISYQPISVSKSPTKESNGIIINENLLTFPRNPNF